MSTEDFVYVKRSSEKERIGIDFSDRLSSSEQLASATYTVLDEDGVDVTSTLTVTDSDQITDKDADGVIELASIRIQAGTDGEDYILSIKATTDDADVIEGKIRIEVRDS